MRDMIILQILCCADKLAVARDPLLPRSYVEWALEGRSSLPYPLPPSAPSSPIPPPSSPGYKTPISSFAEPKSPKKLQRNARR